MLRLLLFIIRLTHDEGPSDPYEERGIFHYKTLTVGPFQLILRTATEDHWRLYVTYWKSWRFGNLEEDDIPF